MISGANGTAAVGDTASFTPIISGGTAPYTVTVTGLPPGRSVTNSATGLTTGAYTTSGTYSATYTVTDSKGATASFTRVVTVTAAAITLQTLSLSPSNATIGTAYSGTITGKTSGSTITLGNTGAAGLSVSGSSVTGTPTTAGAVDLVETLSGATNNPRTTTGLLNVVAASQIPVANWRLGITGAVTDSAGDSTTQTAIQNSSTNKRNAVFSLAANQARTITIPVASVSAPGGLLYLSSYIQDSGLEDPTTATESAVQQSTDGGATYSALTLAQGSKLDRGRAYHLPAGPARLVQFTITAASSACSGSVGVFQRPASGVADIWLIEGASFEDRAYKPYQWTATLNSVLPAQDPMVFNQGYAGQNSQQIRTRTQTDLPNFPLATIVIANQAGNTVTATRPYSAGNSLALALHTEVATLVQSVLDAGKIALVQNISYRDYTTAPLVNQNANPENGSLPYNINEVYPALQSKAPEQFDASLGVTYNDVYALLLQNPGWLSSDGVHLFRANDWASLRAYQAQVWAAKVYGTTLPKSLYEQAVAAAEAGKTQALVNAAQTLLNILTASTAKTALQNRLNAVVVPASAPVNTAVPTISGTPQVGQTLTASQGTWSNSPTSYAYQWSAGGAAISGATSSTYAPVTADAGKTITVTVTATNSAGSASATSAATSAVTAAAATLSALTLSPTTATTGTAYSGTISGKTSGSTITATSSDGTALTVSGTTVTGSFSAAGTPTVTLTETLSGATNTPRTSTVSLTVSAGVTTRKVQVKPYVTANLASGLADWNDVKCDVANSSANAAALKDTTGAATGLSAWTTLTGGASIVDNSQTPTSPNAYPDAIAKSFLYITTGSVVMNIKGFAANQSIPTLNVLASRTTTSDRTSVFATSGQQKSINAKNNTTLLTFTGLTADANGILTLGLSVGTPDGQFSYENGFDFSF